MIATAIALQDATGDAVIDISTMIKAKNLYDNRDNMSSQEFSDALFEYSAHLASLTTTLVVSTLLTKEQLVELNETINEVENMGKDLN
jgi:hypothetical protein